MSAVSSMGVVPSPAPKPADHAIRALWRWSVGGSGLAADAVAARADEVIVTSEVWMARSLPRDNPAAHLRAGDREDGTEGLVTHGISQLGAVLTLVTPFDRDGDRLILQASCRESSMPQILLPIMRAWEKG
jgi:hypothetical protein